MSHFNVDKLIKKYVNPPFDWLFKRTYIRILCTYILKLLRDTSDSQKIITLFFLGLIFRLSLVYLIPAYYPLQSILLTSDSRVYDSIALKILEGLGYNTYWQPGFPIFLSTIYYFVGHNLLFATIILSIIGTLTGVLAFFITEKLFNNKQLGYLAFLLIVFNPYLVFVSPMLLSDTLALFMFGLLLLLTILYIKKNQIFLLPFMGILSGYLLLIRPNYFFFLIIIGFYLLLSKKYSSIFIFVICVSLTLFPWFLYTTDTLGEPALTTNGGYNLFIGNNEKATGYYIESNLAVSGVEEKSLEGSKIASTKAISYIINNPLSAAKNFLKKMFLILFAPSPWPWELPQTQSSGVTKDLYHYASNLIYILTEILGICAILLAWNKFFINWEFKIMVMSLAFLYIIPIVFFVDMRMTLPIFFIYSIFIPFYFCTQFPQVAVKQEIIN